MTELGFHRQGSRLWFKLSSKGDAASVQIRSWPLPGVVSFHVDYGIVTATDQAWRTVLSPTSKDARYPSNGIIWNRLPMPADVLLSNFSEDGEWGFYPQDEHTMPQCGTALASVLEREVVPLLHRLLDRAELQSFIDGLKGNDRSKWCAPTSQARTELDIWLDEWPVTDLQERWLTLFADEYPPSHWARWTKKQILSRIIVGDSASKPSPPQ